MKIVVRVVCLGERERGRQVIWRGLDLVMLGDVMDVRGDVVGRDCG